jgi:hypothetical protein
MSPHRRARSARTTDLQGRGSPFAADVAWAALGHLVGRRSGTRVPVLTGLLGDADEDRLKALGAAAASAGGVALFPAVGLTPEAPDTATAFRGRAAERRYEVTAADLRAACDELVSFWGGSDVATGEITDVRHPQRGTSAAGRVLAFDGSRGSSSSSTLLAEKIRRAAPRRGDPARGDLRPGGPRRGLRR